MPLSFDVLKNYDQSKGGWLYAQDGELYEATSFSDKAWILITDLFLWEGLTARTQALYAQVLQNYVQKTTAPTIWETALKQWYEAYQDQLKVLNSIQDKEITIHWLSQVQTIDLNIAEVSRKTILLNDLKGINCQSHYTADSDLENIFEHYKRVMNAYSFNFKRQPDQTLQPIRTGPWKATYQTKSYTTNSVPSYEHSIKTLTLVLSTFSYVRYNLDQHLDRDLELLRRQIAAIPPRERVPVSIQFTNPYNWALIDSEEKDRAAEVVKKVVIFVDNNPDLFVHHFQFFSTLRSKKVPLQERIDLISHVRDQETAGPQGIFKRATSKDNHTIAMAALPKSVLEQAKTLPHNIQGKVRDNLIAIQSRPFPMRHFLVDRAPHLGRELMKQEPKKDFTLILGQERRQVHRTIVCEAFPWIEASSSWRWGQENKDSISLTSLFGIEKEAQGGDVAYLLDSIIDFAYTRENPFLLSRYVSQGKNYLAALDILCASETSRLI